MAHYFQIKIRLLTYGLLAAELLVSCPGWSQMSPDQAQQLETRYKAAVLRVRDLVSDGKIRYDAAGSLVGKWHPGQWTWHSNVELIKVEAKQGLLKVSANRLLLNYNRGIHKFTALRTGSKLEIEIHLSPLPDGTIDLDKEWSKAFLTPSEEYPLEMQPYWQPFIACLINPKTDECEYYEKKSWEPDVYNVKSTSTWKPNYADVYSYSVGGDVTMPKVRSKVEPVYNRVARNARATGTVLLEAIVTKSGGVHIVRVIRPLGFGLEENAAEALSQWTFEPGRRADQPVDVLLNIEINFNLR
jgi:TonB family protein